MNEMYSSVCLQSDNPEAILKKNMFFKMDKIESVSIGIFVFLLNTDSHLRKKRRKKVGKIPLCI